MHATTMVLSVWYQVRWPSNRIVKCCRDNQIDQSAKILIGRGGCSNNQVPDTRYRELLPQLDRHSEDTPKDVKERFPTTPEPDSWTTKPRNTWSSVKCELVWPKKSIDPTTTECCIVKVWKEAGQMELLWKRPSSDQGQDQGFSCKSEALDSSWTRKSI